MIGIKISAKVETEEELIELLNDITAKIKDGYKWSASPRWAVTGLPEYGSIIK